MTDSNLMAFLLATNMILYIYLSSDLVNLPIPLPMYRTSNVNGKTQNFLHTILKILPIEFRPTLCYNVASAFIEAVAVADDQLTKCF